MKNINIMMILLALSMFSCSKFLEMKPDKKMVLPESLSDVEAILNNVSEMNSGYPGLGEIASDNYYLPINIFNSFSQEVYRDNYIWVRNPVVNTNWSSSYGNIFYANNALSYLNTVKHKEEERNFKNELKGRALFYRSYAFFHLLQVFSKTYNEVTSKDDLGIVLNLSPNVNEVYKRNSVFESYEKVLEDLKLASSLLSEQKSEYPTIPHKAAAYGALSLVYFSMADYDNACLYADSALRINTDVLDYNLISNKRFPFVPFNQEVIFYSQMYVQSNLMPNNARIPSELLEMYDQNDKRKELFFSENLDKTISFTGNYESNENNYQFNGITTAELLLIRSECLIRKDELKDAKKDLAVIIKNRYMDDFRLDLNGMDKEELLRFTFDERRRELIFRGRRWIDLRRLGKEPKYRESLTRNLDGDIYHLTHEEILNYTFLIPSSVIESSGMVQN